jgi:glycosyltransferase involved in cell wall biosynthesis
VRIAVCRPQEPFKHGGTEIFADTLVAELRARGHEAELVTVPFQTWPNERLLTGAMSWRLLDLGPEGPNPAELVIATRFPSYVIEHPNKVVWLVHQLRQAYELDGTERGQFSDSFLDRSFRDRIAAMDRQAFGEARRLFATSANVSGRLRSSTGLEAEVLPHPPQELGYRCDAYDPFVLSVGRLDPWKRVDLLLEAAALVPGLEVVVAGTGPDRERLEQKAAALGIRARFAGRVSGEELARLYATCRAVFYGPYDEDFGMVPLEAFRAAKPVLTTTDAGGPLDFVVPGETGWVCDPAPEALAVALHEALADQETARRLGEAGKPRADAITWDSALERLLG